MYLIGRILTITVFLWLASAELKISEYDQERKDEILGWHEICEDVTGIKDDEIKKMKAGDFPDRLAMKQYILCMWRTAGIITTDLTFRRWKLMSLLPGRLETGEEMDMVQECLDQGKQSGGEKYDQLYEMQKCLYRKDSNDILMF